jgi:hypothetical protein
VVDAGVVIAAQIKVRPLVARITGAHHIVQADDALRLPPPRDVLW